MAGLRVLHLLLLLLRTWLLGLLLLLLLLHQLLLLLLLLLLMWLLLLLLLMFLLLLLIPLILQQLLLAVHAFVLPLPLTKRVGLKRPQRPVPVRDRGKGRRGGSAAANGEVHRMQGGARLDPGSRLCVGQHCEVYGC